MKSKKRHLLARISLLLATVLVMLVVAELALRYFAPIYSVSIPGAYEYDAELGTRLSSGIHLFRTTDFQEEIRTNQLGTVNFQENFAGYRWLVFAVGDSYTQGTGLPADMAYPAQLDLILNRDQEGFYAGQYGIVNLGIAAIGGEQELLALRRWRTLIRPPEIILYLGSDNDYQDDLLFKSGYRHNHVVAGSPKWGSLVTPLQWLTNDLQIGLRLKTIVGQQRRVQVRETAGPALNNERSISIAELEKPVLEKLVAYSREQPALLIVSWSGKGDSYDWLKSWSRDNGVAFADWVPKVESVRLSIPALPTENSHSGRHHRGWVNYLIAEEYARQIRALRK